jgi:hypothetical protein
MKAAPALIVLATAAIATALLLAGPRTTFAAVEPQASPDSSAGQNPMEQRIVSKEREGLDALISGNLQVFADLTAGDAVFVDAQGPATKAQVLKNVAGFKLASYSMEDIRFVRISSKSGLITYKITEKGVSHGKEFTAHSYIGSVWEERMGKWVLLFSQETGSK